MVAFKPPITPALDKWNVEQGGAPGRPWDGCGVRYNVVTTGQPYTLPTSQGPEEARALLILNGTGNLVVKNTASLGAESITFTNITGPILLPLLTSQVVSASGTLANIYWIS